MRTKAYLAKPGFWIPAVVAIMVSTSSQAQWYVYNNLTTAATAGYSEANSNAPIFGDSLNLTSGGVVSSLGLTLYNSTSGGNTGSILKGNMTVKFYDNTTPYGGGPLTDPLLATVVLNWDFTSGGGLQAGFYSASTFDLSSLNISIPQHILITQQFTETSGTSTRNGIILFGDPTIGSSPANVYINSAATAEGLYTFGGGNPNQFGYALSLVPEPSSAALAGLGMAALLIFRRRK
jgi:hypothetical protein